MGVPSIWKYVTGENRKVAEDSSSVSGIRTSLQNSLRPPSGPQLGCCVQLSWPRWPIPNSGRRAGLSSTSIPDGAEVGALIRKVYASPKALIERMKQVLRR
jgi:hypothetical protein